MLKFRARTPELRGRPCFQKKFNPACSSEDRVKALADAFEARPDPLPDPSPPLNTLEQRQVGFQLPVHSVRWSGQSPPTSSIPISLDRSHPSSGCHDPSSKVRLASLSRTGSTKRLAPTRSHCERNPTPPPPIPPPSFRSRRALLTGVVGLFSRRTTGTNSLCRTSAGLARPRHIYHNNSAATLEEVVDHLLESSTA